MEIYSNAFCYDAASLDFPRFKAHHWEIRPSVESERVMELSPSRYPRQSPWEGPRAEGANMLGLTIRQSRGHHLPGPTALLDSKLPDPPAISRSENRPRSESTQLQSSPVQLPPIREIVDFSTRIERPEAEYREYRTDDHSPTSYAKRRRPEEDEADDWREPSYPRLSSSQRSPQRSPRLVDQPQSTLTSDPPRRASVAYSTGSWSPRSSPYQTSQGLPPLQPPPTFASRQDRKQSITLPSLTSLTQNHAHPSTVPRNFTEYSLDPLHTRAQTYPLSTRTPSSKAFPQFSSLYGSQQPRGQSYSGPSSYSIGHDRSSFSSAPSAIFPGVMHPYGSDEQDINGDNRQRKRRGNLPKETTDKLRAWFVSHLQHPYPTEDEKQELMKQTGLQMNQISNWFINARRRQLPAMINNARAESDARSGRNGEGHARAHSNDYGEESDRRSLRDSDGEGSVFDEEFDVRQRGAMPGPNKRGSI